MGAMVAQAASDSTVAGPAQQIDGCVPQHCQDCRSSTDMDEAAVLTEGDILDVVQVVFYPPVVSLEFQQPGSICDIRCQAGDTVADFSLAGVLLPALRGSQRNTWANPGQS